MNRKQHPATRTWWRPGGRPIRPLCRATLVTLAVLLGVAASPGLAAEPVRVGYPIIREISVEEGRLRTLRILNRISAGEVERLAAVADQGEFAIVWREPGKDGSHRVTAADFKVAAPRGIRQEGLQLSVDLTGSAPFDVTVRYESGGERSPWIRKRLEITAKAAVVIEAVEVERLGLADASEPYRADEFTAVGPSRWRPPLGQPVYTGESALWLGLEFPAARNTARGGVVVCRQLTEVALAAGEKWTSPASAIGGADDPEFVKDAFLDYIHRTRARPFRLQTQYNSWFDYGPGVDREKFVASVEKIAGELRDRKVRPLNAYVIDDGWQDRGADWARPETGVWPVNGKFDPDFAQCRVAVSGAESHLGLWLSPGALFGASQAIGPMKAAGWRSLDPWMSMTGEEYMGRLEERLVGLAGKGVNYFKLDGVFGHLNQRNFDIEGFKGGEKELNDPKYDEAKERYLSLGSERLARIFQRMGEVNPDVYIVISNGAWLSPWWLRHVDAVWMINAGDAAGGSSRTEELVYRDAAYHRLAAADRDNTQFPLDSIFNHEPKKTSTGEDEDTFRRYLFMNLSRGTGFVELYLKTFQLGEGDWDVLAEGLNWVERVHRAFPTARMVGGDPKKGEVYGYSGWDDRGRFGYLSLHNPSEEPRSFKFTLDRRAGLSREMMDRGTPFRVSSPLGEAEVPAATIPAGDTVELVLPPKAIRVFEFR